MNLSPVISPGALDYYELLGVRHGVFKRTLRRVTDTPARLHRTEQDYLLAPGELWPCLFSALAPWRGRTHVVLLAQLRNQARRMIRNDVHIWPDAEERWTADSVCWSSNGPMFVDGQPCDPVGFGLAFEDRPLFLCRARSEPGVFDQIAAPIEVRRGAIGAEDWAEWFGANPHAAMPLILG